MTPEEKRQQVREKIAQWFFTFQYPMEDITDATWYREADRLISLLDSLDVVIKDDEQSLILLKTNMDYTNLAIDRAKHYKQGQLDFIKSGGMRTFRLKE